MTTLPNNVIPLSVEISPEVSMLLWNAQIAWNEKAGWFTLLEQSPSLSQPIHVPVPRPSSNDSDHGKRPWPS